MTELLAIYKWTLAGGMTAGAALALIGSQLASRNQALQTLVVSQGASLGIVSGLAIATHFGFGHESSLVPIVSGFVAAGLLHFFCNRAEGDPVSKNTLYVGLFAGLMAATYLIVGLVPSLETHMSAAYFGDLALASDPESILLLGLSVLALGFVLKRWRAITAWSFRSMTFGAFAASRGEKVGENAFGAVTLALVVTSVQLFGLLFTIGAMFLPALLALRAQRGLGGARRKLVVSSSAGVALGFSFSLWHGQLPTVPTITGALILASFVISKAFGRSLKAR